MKTHVHTSAHSSTIYNRRQAETTERPSTKHGVSVEGDIAEQEEERRRGHTLARGRSLKTLEVEEARPI